MCIVMVGAKSLVSGIGMMRKEIRPLAGSCSRVYGIFLTLQEPWRQTGNLLMANGITYIPVGEEWQLDGSI